MKGASLFMNTSISLYVPIGEQKRAIQMGALFQRKQFFSSNPPIFFVSDGLNDQQQRQLSLAYGEQSARARMEASAILSEWKAVLLHGNHFDILTMAKRVGFPKDDKLMEQFFLKIKDTSKGDYPVSWEHLRAYIPSFDETFGKDRYLALHRDYDLKGDLVQAISQSDMPKLDKYFLYFVYEIQD